MQKSPDTGKTYLIYARVSPKGSTWSAEETSIAVQLSDCRAYVQHRDPRAKFIEIVDEFKSGKNLNRPGVRQLIADLDLNPVPFDCLVVWNLDRLSRSLLDALPIFTRLHDKEIDFISVNQEYLTYKGAMGRFMLQQTIAVAELERGMCSERTSAKMHWIAKSGKIPYGRLPYAFYRDPSEKNCVRVDQKKAEIVRFIFDQFNDGRLTWSVIRTLYPGEFKNRQTLYAILRQPLYIGELHYGGVTYHPNLPHVIDRETFDRAQELLAMNQQPNNRRHSMKESTDYLLSGILHCHCGRCMTGYSVKKGGKTYRYYKCTSPDCSNAVNAEAMDDAVLKQIAAVFSDEEEVKRGMNEYLASIADSIGTDADRQKEIDQAKRDLDAAVDQEAKIKALFLSGEVTKENAEYWNDELAKVIASQKRLKEVIAAPLRWTWYKEEEVIPLLMEAAREWAEMTTDGTASFVTKKNLISSTVKSITCTSREPQKVSFDME